MKSSEHMLKISFIEINSILSYIFTNHKIIERNHHTFTRSNLPLHSQCRDILPKLHLPAPVKTEIILRRIKKATTMPKKAFKEGKAA